ncbi:MAG: endonuclease domain-containing protein [Legionella sp.]|nr:endonuclease domain-containing protein [Legionella sp.]
MKEHARLLRKNKTDAAERVWYFLRNRRLNGYKFVREMVIGHYIGDFVCRAKGLVIELDGGQHLEAVEYDARRTRFLEANGYQVLRIWNNEVFDNIEGVMDGILQALENLPNRKALIPSLSPTGGRRES